MLAQKLQAMYGPAAVNPPAYVDHVTNAGTTGGNLTIDLSALDMQSGDLLIVFAASDSSSASTPTCSTLSTVYADTDLCHYLGYTAVGATPPGSVTVNNVGDSWVTLALSFRYCDWFNSGWDDNSNQMPNAPALSVGNAASLLLLIGFLEDDLVSTTPPSGFSELVDLTFGSSSSGGTLMVATKTAGVTGSLDPAAWGGSGSDAGLAFIIELSPL